MLLLVLSFPSALAHLIYFDVYQASGISFARLLLYTLFRLPWFRNRCATCPCSPCCYTPTPSSLVPVMFLCCFASLFLCRFLFRQTFVGRRLCHARVPGHS